MKFVITKQGALFALMLIVALFAYIYITSPILDFIKVFGCSLSLLLFLIAMEARLCKHIDTKQLGADWALLFVGACGLSFFIFFWDRYFLWCRSFHWINLYFSVYRHNLFIQDIFYLLRIVIIRL